MLSVSVVICCWNAEHYLRDCLESLLAQEELPREVLVVDGGSQDGSRALVADYETKHPDWLRWLDQGSTPGLAHARNVGVQAARGDVISFLDVDARARSDWVRRARLHFEQDAGLAGVGGQGIEIGPTPPDRFRAVYYQQGWGSSPRSDVVFLFGLCSHYRRATLEKIGRFDPRFLSSGEDVNLGLRLRARGERLAYDPLLVVEHARRDDWRSLYQMVYRWSYFGRLAALTLGSRPRPVGFWVVRLLWVSLRWLVTQVPRSRFRPEGWWRRPYCTYQECLGAWRAEREFRPSSSCAERP